MHGAGRLACAPPPTAGRTIRVVRALYLVAAGKDTLYRIHGTNEPHSIGDAVSSGCIRMLKQDIAELFDRVEPGTIVQVRPSEGAQV